MRKKRPLRTGFTTGACATAAARAAYAALRGGEFPDPVEIRLPGGERPRFPLADTARGDGWARAGIVKDAGDDPDVTHGVLVLATLRPAPPGSSMRFVAGEGVGTVTLPGLPVPPGEPAINPGPRLMIREALAADNDGEEPDVEVEIAIPGGEALARRTLNPRLGIVGGLSVLGTTGIVRPYSCAAWIATIREGVDVARALGIDHIAGSTGRTSEAAARRFHHLPEQALIDMGDFAGGLLKYIRAHPVPRLTIAGGPAKLAKLAGGRLDLHSRRGGVDMTHLARWAAEAGADDGLVRTMVEARSVVVALQMARAAGVDLPAAIAVRALVAARRVLRDAPVAMDILVVDRGGEVIARAAEDGAA